MKSLPWIILLVALLVTVVAGCGGMRRHDARLAAADSLMQSDPDSALAIVEAVCRDSLASEGDRAYRDLLLTQARYRCYIPATSDSDISRALAWYRAHDGEREKLTRALIYKGAVMEELSHPDSAMLYYKQAEASAAPHDYFNLGYSNLRIAELYQGAFNNDNAVIERMRIAENYFNAIKDTNFLITAIGAQGLFPKIIGRDSSYSCLEKAISLANAIHSPKRFKYESKLAGLYFYDKNYLMAKNLAMDIVNHGKDDCDEKQFYYYAVRSYLKLNLIDSALLVKSMIPPPSNAVDSMNHFLMLASLAQTSHDYDANVLYNDSANIINEHILNASANSPLHETELSFVSQQRENNIHQHERSRLLIIIILASIGLIALFLVARQYLIKAKIYYNELIECRQDLGKTLLDYESRIKEYQEQHTLHVRTLALKEQQLSELNMKNIQLEAIHNDFMLQVSQVVSLRHSALNELYNSIRVKSQSRNLPLAALLKELNENKHSINLTLKTSFWEKLQLSIDGEYCGLATFVKNNYSDLSQKDYHLFLLMCAGLSNTIIKLCMGYTNDVTVSKNKKKLLVDRMGLQMNIKDFIDLYIQELREKNKLD